MKRKLYIFPMGGNGIEALDCLDEDRFEFRGFIDDNKAGLQGPNGTLVLTRSIINDEPDAVILAVPGSPSGFLKRKDIIASLGIPDERYASVIHPYARIGKNVHVGKNCLIMAGVVLTSNAWIGDHVCILPNTVIHHDVKIEDHTLIGSNVAIAGNTMIGHNCYIGSGTNIINNVKVGAQTLIGLGSNVIRDVPPLSQVAGNPARQINKK